MNNYYSYYQNNLNYILLIYLTGVIWRMQVQLIILNTITSTRGLELPSTWWAFGLAGIYTLPKSHRLDSPKYKAPICDYPHKNGIELNYEILFYFY